MELHDYAGRTEYALSGWVRWVVPSNSKPYHLVAKLSVFKPAKNQEFSLLILKAVNYYHFATYDDYREKKFLWNARFSEDIEQSWNYLYFGYKAGRAKGFVYFSGDQEAADDEQPFFV